MKSDYLTAFQTYTERYNTSDSKVHLKIIHTYHVAEVMEELCRRRRIQGHLADLAWLCALFHDIGRFEQLRRYGTFSDGASIDHAALGCQVLQEEGFLSGLPKQDQSLILTAIRNHNQYEIQPGLSGEALTLCRLIRDADKCDIFRVFATDDLKDVTGCSEEEAAAWTVSPAVAQAIFSHRCVRQEERKTGLDFWVSFLGFFFDMAYPESIAIAREQGYYRLPFERTRFLREDTAQLIAMLLRETELYCSGRLATLSDPR